MAEPGADTRARLEQLRRDYVAGLPRRWASIREARRGLGECGWNAEALSGLHRAVHGLTGSGLSFGFPALSDAARAVEHRLAEFLAAGVPPGEAGVAEVDAELRRLEAVIGAIVETEARVAAAGAAPSVPAPDSK